MTSELGEKWYERKMEGEMSVRSGPLTSRARGKFHVSATEHLQRPVAMAKKDCILSRGRKKQELHFWWITSAKFINTFYLPIMIFVLIAASKEKPQSIESESEQ